MTAKLPPRYRADYVGSLLRQDDVMPAHQKFYTGKPSISSEELLEPFAT